MISHGVNRLVSVTPPPGKVTTVMSLTLMQCPQNVRVQSSMFESRTK